MPKKLLLVSSMIISMLTYANASSYPVKIQNCKTDIVVKKQPKRALVSNTPAIDNMMALGLFEHIYGVSEETITNYPDNIPWASQRKKLKQLTKGDAVLSEESVLNLEPDFVYASFHWFLHSNETATREVLTKFDIPSYLSPTECNGQIAKPDKSVTFEMIFSELKDLGKVFGVTERANKLVADLQTRVDNVAEKSKHFKPAKVLWYYSGTDTPYVAGCCGAPELLSKVLNMDNVYSKVQSIWPSASWELIADSNPDFIIIGHLADRVGEGQTAEDKIAFLESNPVTKELDAVKSKKYITVRGRYMDSSVLSVWLLEQIAEEREKHNW